MNSELEELYQEVLLDHSKRPRNYGEIAEGAIRVDGDNPSCGDEIHLHVRFGDEGKVEEIKFTGQGCAISQASASMMTLKLMGKSREEAGEMLAAFHDLVTLDAAEAPKMLGDLRVMQGVRKFPQRVKCAMLAWRAFEQARESAAQGKAAAEVSTEQPEEGAE
jgi:nitrogen fixation NifU-like protein